jgi:hypothetical protein
VATAKANSIPPKPRVGKDFMAGSRKAAKKLSPEPSHPQSANRVTVSE